MYQKALLAAKLIKELSLAQDAERLEGSFYAFCKDAWTQVDPSEFVDNWHLEDICNHIEAVVFGHIPRLLINEPPRTGKSFIVSVCLIPWIWAQRCARHVRRRVSRLTKRR